MQYCDRECQRLHWFVHKKSCARPVSTPATATPTNTEQPKPEIDQLEISEQLQNLITR